MDYAFQYVEQNALETEEEYSYDGSDDSCAFNSSLGLVKISGYEDVPPNNQIALKAAVAQQPVSIAIEADTKTFQLYKSGIITSDSCGTSLDHGVLIVGYGNEDNTDYWLVKNSWSSSWGDEGYVKIARSDDTNDPGICGIAMQPSYPIV